MYLSILKGNIPIKFVYNYYALIGFDIQTMEYSEKMLLIWLANIF